MQGRFQVGDRVRIVGHWEFDDGITGTIREPVRGLAELAGPGEWEGPRRVQVGPKGVMSSYYVEFDEPHDDGSGDGPYRGAEIDEDALEQLPGGEAR